MEYGTKLLFPRRANPLLEDFPFGLLRNVKLAASFSTKRTLSVENSNSTVKLKEDSGAVLKSQLLALERASLLKTSETASQTLEDTVASILTSLALVHPRFKLKRIANPIKVRISNSPRPPVNTVPSLWLSSCSSLLRWLKRMMCMRMRTIILST